MKHSIISLGLISAFASPAMATTFTLDGVNDGASYNYSQTVTWFNGHQTSNTNPPNH